MSGSWDDSVRVWAVGGDPASWTELRRLDGHTSYVRSVAFSPDGTKARGGAGRGGAEDPPARARSFLFNFHSFFTFGQKTFRQGEFLKGFQIRTKNAKMIKMLKNGQSLT